MPGRETGPTGRRGSRRPPLEGSLVSDTTEFLTTSHDTAAPIGAPSGVTAPVLAGEDGAGPVSRSAPSRSRRGAGGGLAAMLLPELQQMAQSMGIKGTGRMRKGEIIAAIQERQGGTATAAAPQARTARDRTTRRSEARRREPASLATLSGTPRNRVRQHGPGPGPGRRRRCAASRDRRRRAGQGPRRHGGSGPGRHRRPAALRPGRFRHGYRRRGRHGASAAGNRGDDGRSAGDGQRGDRRRRNGRPDQARSRGDAGGDQRREQSGDQRREQSAATSAASRAATSAASRPSMARTPAAASPQTSRAAAGR